MESFDNLISLLGNDLNINEFIPSNDTEEITPLMNMFVEESSHIITSEPEVTQIQIQNIPFRYFQIIIVIVSQGSLVIILFL